MPTIRHVLIRPAVRPVERRGGKTQAPAPRSRSDIFASLEANARERTARALVVDAREEANALLDALTGGRDDAARSPEDPQPADARERR
jgi:hypothetical protein